MNIRTLAGWLLLYTAVLAGYPVGEAIADEAGPAAEAALEQQKDESLLGIHVGTGMGDSMEPTLSEGARALCVEHVEPAVGTIVVVDGDETHRSHDMRHRVVEIRDDEIVTKGDGNDYRDDPVPREAVKCSVVWAQGAGWNP